MTVYVNINLYGLFPEMAVKGISVNVVTCNTLLCGFIVGKLKEATNFLNEMVLKTINPSVYTYDILVDALCKKRKGERSQKYDNCDDEIFCET